MSLAGLGPDFAGPGLGSQISARNAVVGSRIVGSQPFARTNNVHLPGMARGRRSALQTANFMALQTRVEAQQTPSSLEKWESSSGRGLPEELVLLQDPTVQVRMPPPGSVDPFSLDDASLDQLITNGQPLRALDIYEWMRSDEHVEEGSSRVPSVHTYTVAIRAASAANLLDRAWRIWNEAKASGVDADSRLCCSFIEVLSKQGRTDEALRIFTQMLAAPRGSSRAPSVHAFTTAMRAATSGGRWETALEIWGHMHQHNVKPTGHAYAAAISACAAGSDCKRAMALFKEMLRINIRPDVVLCTALITALASNGLARDACRMVAWMKDNGLAPNVRTYTALLTAYGNACMFNEAVDLVLSMQAGRLGNVQPNAYTYSVLFKALGENGQWQLAEAVFSQLESEALKDMGIPVTPIMQQAPNTKPAPPQPRPSHSPETSSRHADTTTQGHRSVENGALLLSESSSSSRRRLGASASGMVKSWSHSSLSDLPRNGSVPAVSAADSSSSGDSSRHGMHATGPWTSPSQLNGLDLGAIESDPTPSLPLILSSLMLSGSSSFFSTDSLYAADAAVDAAAPPQPPPTPSPPAGEAAKRQAAAEEDAELAERARQGKELLSLLLAPAPVPHRRRHRHADVINQVVCGALMLAYERAHLWGQAVAVISRARRLGVKPNTIMFNTAISAAGRASQLQVAAELFRQVEEPDCVTFETLLTAYGNVGDVERAEEVFSSMVEVGFKPRDYAFCGLITAYTQAKDFGRAMAVRQRMLQMQVPLTIHVYNSLLVACTENYEYEKALEVYGQLRQDGVQPNALTQNIMETTKTMGIRNVEKQQMAAAAMSAAVAAAGAVMARMGAF